MVFNWLPFILLEGVMEEKCNHRYRLTTKPVNNQKAVNFHSYNSGTNSRGENNYFFIGFQYHSMRQSP